MHRYLCTVTAAAMLVVAACSNEAKDVFAPDQKALTAEIESGKLSGDALAAAYLQRAYRWYIIGDQAKTIDDCSKAIGASPKDVDAYKLRAEVYRKSGRLDEALADASQAVALAAPTDSAPFLLRAEVLKDRHAYADAVADYDEVLKRSPDTWEAYVYRGAALAEAGDLERAVADLDHAIATDPGLIHKSSFQECTRTNRSTTVSCGKTETGTPTTDFIQQAHFARGLVFFRKAEYPRSINDFQHADTLEARLYGGLAELALGDCDAGYAEISRAYGDRAAKKVLEDHRDFIAKTACPEES